MKPSLYRIPEIRVQRVCEAEQLPVLSNAELVRSAWRQLIETASWFDPEKECFVVFVLNRKNRIVAYNLVSLGSATGTLCHPREVLRPVLCAGGSAFICAHNHPSGDPSPSTADTHITRQLEEAAKIMDIAFMDHVVIGDAQFDPSRKGYYSFREVGII